VAGFSELERINLAAKTLAAGVKDADPTTQWYESTLANSFVLAGDKVWIQADTLRANPATNLAAAQALCIPTAPLDGIVLDRSAAGNAVRLTPVPGVNNTYVALETYGDISSGRVDNWVLPQFVPLANGLPSSGFGVRLYNGNPATTGVPVLTTAGATGTGINKTVAWIWDYATGILLLSNTFSVADPWVNGFQYIGVTAGSLVGNIGSITNVFGDLIGDAENIEDIGGDHIGDAQTINNVGGNVIIENGGSVTIAAPRHIRQPFNEAPNGVIVTFTTPVKFVRTGVDREEVFHNGVLQEDGVGNDYTVSESGGVGTGFDTVNFLYAVEPSDKVIISYTPAP